jgi:hypothetical protein
MAAKGQVVVQHITVIEANLGKKMMKARTQRLLKNTSLNACSIFFIKKVQIKTTVMATFPSVSIDSVEF